MKEELVKALTPIVEFLDSVDPADEAAAAKLEARFPIAGDAMQSLATLVRDGIDAGWLCDREGGPGMSYSRVSKSIGKLEFSIDAVNMDSPGPGHSHPGGEFDLCFSASGEPVFDGNAPGWTVYPPGSWHVPTVTGGRMHILYFLPSGAIAFGPKPE